MGPKSVKIIHFKTDTGPLGVSVDVLFAHFEAYVGHFDSLDVQDPPKKSCFRPKDGYKLGPKMHFFPAGP